MLNESYPESSRQDTLGRNPNTDMDLGLTSHQSLACTVLCGLHHHLQASPEKYMSKKMAGFLDKAVQPKQLHCASLLRVLESLPDGSQFFSFACLVGKGSSWFSVANEAF